jgi:opacity protein-like surface antigen
MKFRIALLASAVLFAGAASAGDGLYAGAGVGGGTVSLPGSKITNDVVWAFDYAGAPLVTWSYKTHETATMWSAFAGYRFLKYFGIEAGYLDTGTVSYRGSGTADLGESGILPAKANLDWRAYGWPVSALAAWPINDRWEIFGRAGAFFGNVRDDLKITIDTVSEKAHDTSSTTEFIGGVGFNGQFMDQWSARFEWLTIPSLGSNHSGSADWNAFQFSLLYSF